MFLKATIGRQMSLKLVIESPEKIRLFDPDLQNNLKTYFLRPLIIFILFSPLLYFFGIFHPSYEIYCAEKSAAFASGCTLKSTYYFIIPRYTHLGDLKYASFQINPRVNRNKVRNSCGEIALLSSTVTNPLSYAGEAQQQSTFFLSCGNFAELRQIADGINYYLKTAQLKKLNIPSLPRTRDQYLWIIALLAASVYQSKRTEVSFDKHFRKSAFCSRPIHPFLTIKPIPIRIETY